MNWPDALAWLGRLLGLAGIVICAISGIARLAGRYAFDGFPVITLFEGGTTVLVAGCFFLLCALAARR
jgi:energy-converting hydrogenase Eha subunit C